MWSRKPRVYEVSEKDLSTSAEAPGVAPSASAAKSLWLIPRAYWFLFLLGENSNSIITVGAKQVEGIKGIMKEGMQSLESAQPPPHSAGICSLSSRWGSVPTLGTKAQKQVKYRDQKSICGGKDLNRHFFREDMLMVDKHVKDA